jgi:hypothetical protein
MPTLGDRNGASKRIYWQDARMPKERPSRCDKWIRRAVTFTPSRSLAKGIAFQFQNAPRR